MDSSLETFGLMTLFVVAAVGFLVIDWARGRDSGDLGVSAKSSGFPASPADVKKCLTQTRSTFVEEEEDWVDVAEYTPQAFSSHPTYSAGKANAVPYILLTEVLHGTKYRYADWAGSNHRETSD